jgi:hypothetical protein
MRRGLATESVRRRATVLGAWSARRTPRRLVTAALVVGSSRPTLASRDLRWGFRASPRLACRNMKRASGRVRTITLIVRLVPERASPMATQRKCATARRHSESGGRHQFCFEADPATLTQSHAGALAAAAGHEEPRARRSRDTRGSESECRPARRRAPPIRQYRASRRTCKLLANAFGQERLAGARGYPTAQIRYGRRAFGQHWAADRCSSPPQQAGGTRNRAPSPPVVSTPPRISRRVRSTDADPLRNVILRGFRRSILRDRREPNQYLPSDEARSGTTPTALNPCKRRGLSQ